MLLLIYLALFQVLNQFEAKGITRDRVSLQPLLATTPEHLRAYAHVDIALDSFPYAGTKDLIKKCAWLSLLFV